MNAYQIMDTAPEDHYDDLTELASRLCKMPIAVVTLLDESRQWFKSQIGLSVPETPREWSFCHHAIMQDTIMIVPDALKDERFKDSPLILEDPHFRSYAGVPLVTPAGVKLGTLCVIDVVPRNITETEIWILEKLAAQVMRHLNTRREASILSESANTQRQQLESLQGTLGQLEWMQSLLTICSSCNQIRDDQNRWRSIEDYLQKNSPVEFSHGICPDCRIKLYPPLS